MPPLLIIESPTVHGVSAWGEGWNMKAFLGGASIWGCMIGHNHHAYANVNETSHLLPWYMKGL
jgi:hypothetical protein